MVELARQPVGRDGSFTRLKGRVTSLFAMSELGVLAAIVVISLIFSAIQPAFLSAENLRAIVSFVSFVGIIAIGEAVLLIVGELDLSVGSVAGLGAIVTGKLMTGADLPFPLAVLGGLIIGALIGLFNGVVVVRLKIPAFIQTLGMLFIGQGLIQVLTNGYPVYPLPDAVGDFGQQLVVFGLGWSFVVFVLLAVATDFTLRRTVLGRNVYATGGNAEVARLVGINSDLYKIGGFVLVATLATLAGIFVMADLASGTPSIGQGWELNVIAGVVVGGISLFGGAGTIVGALCGMLLLQVLQSGLVVIGVGANWQQIAVGTIMVIAVGLDLLRRRIFIAGNVRPEDEVLAGATAAATDAQ